MRKQKIFYGWWIVLAGSSIAVLQSGFYVYGFGVFYVHLLEALGSSRAALGGVIGLARLEGGLISPLSGWLIDRYGPRRFMFLGITVIGIGFIVLSITTQLWTLYVLFLVMSAGASIGGMRGVTVALANWFSRNRGKAMGFYYVGSGLGGSLGFALAWLISTFGWRSAALTAGCIFMALGYPLASLIYHRPEQKGLLPDGVLPERSTSPDDDSENPSYEQQQGEPEFSPRQALRTRAFWMLAIGYAGWSSVVTVVTVYQIPYFMEDMGVTFVRAAAIASLVPAVSLVGRLGFGWLSDHIDVRVLLSSLFFFQAVGLAILANIPNAGWAPLYLLIFAPAYGGSLPLRSVIVAHFYGRRNFGTISGLLTFVDLPGTVLGPIFVGAVFDTLGSYRPGFLVIAVWMLVGSVALFTARRPVIEQEVDVA